MGILKMYLFKKDFFFLISVIILMAAQGLEYRAGIQFQNIGPSPKAFKVCKNCHWTHSKVFFQYPVIKTGGIPA